VDGVQPAGTSIPEMAAAYIEAIRTVQPRGPYALGGYSMGGEIAFEMARQLLAVGERIGLLVLFETSNPVRPIRAAQAAAQKGPGYGDLDAMPHYGPKGLSAAALSLGDAHKGLGYAEARAASHEGSGEHGAGGVASGLAVVMRKLANHRQRLAGLTPAEQVRYLGRDARMRLRRLYIQAATRFYRLRRRRLPDELLIAHLVESHTRALDHYLPEFYPGTLTLFRARQSLALNPTDDPLGWGPLAAQVDLHVFDSTHNIVDAQFAREVAGKLAELLEKEDLTGLEDL
jgi:thioesterase domain-containing protein